MGVLLAYCFKCLEFEDTVEFGSAIERDNSRSSTCSTVLIKSLIKFCKSFKESAILAAR